MNFYHFFIWGGNLFHAVLYIETCIYKPFVNFLPANKDQMMLGISLHLNQIIFKYVLTLFLFEPE